MRTIFLIGMMGTGKTSVGKAVAEGLGTAFFDTDIEIERSTSMSVRALFSEQGEAAFRLLENRILRTLPAQNAVVATGGGIVLDATNREWMQGMGVVLLLTASVETIITRVDGDDKRPLLRGNIREKLLQLQKSRTEMYLTSADYVINTDYKRPDEISAEIIRIIHLNNSH